MAVPGNENQAVKKAIGYETKATEKQSIAVGSGLGYRINGVKGGPGTYWTAEDITADTTTTTAPKGSVIMCNGTTLGLFQSDGTKWQFITNA